MTVEEIAMTRFFASATMVRFLLSTIDRQRFGDAEEWITFVKNVSPRNGKKFLVQSSPGGASL
jgi:hypothetical protein